MFFGKHEGSLNILNDNLEADSNNDLVSGQLLIDMNTIDMNDLGGDSEALFISQIQSPSFFNTQKHPYISLKLNNISDDQVSGVLSVKGITHPIDIDLEKTDNTYNGSILIKREDFNIGIEPDSLLLSLGNLAFADEIKIEFKMIINNHCK